MPTTTLLWFFVPPLILVVGAVTFFVLSRPGDPR